MLLSVENLNAYYDRIHVLRDISLEVQQGEIASIIGSNGAGKSTLLKSICGLIHQKTGNISFKGKKIQTYEAYRITRLGISMVPENRQIFYELSVLDNLLLGTYTIRGRKRLEIAAHFEEIFELFPILKSRRKQYGGTLSGGEQQMLAIGRAIMSKPDLLLLDEPSIGLAPLIVKDIFRTIIKLNRLGTTMCLVEQNARLALQISHRGYVMENGRIIISGDSAFLARNPKIKEAYLGERI